MDQVSGYFNAEKTESIFFVLAGVLAMAIAFYFIFILKKPFQNGIAYAITVIALIQIAVGTSVYIRSPKDIERVSRIIQTEKEKIQAEEIPRMNMVMTNFKLYKYMEIALIVAGIILFFILKNEMWKGIGAGLVIQSSIMLFLDILAANRGDAYLKFLQSITYN